MSKGRVVLIVLSAIVVILIAVLGGIAIGKHGNASSESPTSSSSTTSSTEISSKQTTANKSSSTTSSNTSCPNTATEATKVSSSGAAGTIVVKFQITNTSTQTCSLNGYPDIGLINAAGGSVSTSVSKGSGGVSNWPKATSVSLPAGSYAYFGMSYSDVPAGSATCTDYPKLFTTLPNQTAAIIIAGPYANLCGASVSVSAITKSPPV